MGEYLLYIFFSMAHFSSTGCPEHPLNFFHTHYFLIYFGQVIFHFNYYSDMKCLALKIVLTKINYCGINFFLLSFWIPCSRPNGLFTFSLTSSKHHVWWGVTHFSGTGCPKPLFNLYSTHIFLHLL